ncbi:phosphoribosyltransferase domain-containing protein [Deinococcus pimensis]|uniref:phosphoribosyltransferase domain-containing protein n=1 Tax=Deinococcus pimensis TaxID=309888 RepID=UPI0004AF27AD|nr:phosphoribosyltransferase domain-containing protein [Deinococcus pimensis]
MNAVVTPWIHDLPCGRLTLTLTEGTLDAARLLTVGVRQNPRRGFLLLSRVLGKHLPARPGEMSLTYELLGRQVAPDVTLVIGMAETATALGRGVFEAMGGHADHDGRLFVTTTRYRVAPDFLTFEETHSHATAQLLHVPTEPSKREVFLSARHIAIVDDEISTGATALNLIRALAARLPALERVTVVSLKDFAPASAYEGSPVHVERRSLLRGVLSFASRPDWAPTLPDVRGEGEHRAPAGGERLGVWAGETGTHVNEAAPGERVLVLGTGEYMSAAHALARRVENAGSVAWVKATTRSPVLPHGEILERAEFPDNYGQGIPNYLYRSPGETYDRVLIVAETPDLPAGLLDVLRNWYGAEVTCV